MGLARLDDLVTALRDYGCTVIEDAGWRARGTRYSFDPVGQLFHHDALSENVSDPVALQMMRIGHSSLSGPLCNGWIDSDSRVWLVAAGNANHAGWGELDVLSRLRQGLAPVGDARDDPDGDTVVGNSHLWGWECRNAGDGVDVWEQLAAMERAGAALADVCGWGPNRIAAHREWTARKPDPRGIDMHRFRADVARIITQRGAPTPQEDDDDMPLVYDLTEDHPDRGASWLVHGNVRYKLPNPDYRKIAVEAWGEKYVGAGAWDLIRSVTALDITSLVDADDNDPAEIARIVLEGLEGSSLSDEQTAAIVAAMPAAVKQALREGTR